MNKSVLFITIAVIVMGILFAVVAFENFQPTAPYQSDSSTSVATTNLTILGSGNGTTTQTLPGVISQSQLAAHGSKTDCWVGYNGKAYDLTSWLPRHPGSSAAIEPYCGTSTEFEQAFQRKHGTSKSSLFMKVAIYKGDLQ